MTDAEIVALADQAAAGDDAAWTQLHTTFTPQVKSWAHRSGASSDDLDDVASVVWCNLWRAMRSGKKFESGAKLLSYLAQSVRRQVIDLWRRTQVRPQCYSLAEADRPVLQSTLVIELDGLNQRERRLAELLVSGWSIDDIALHDGVTSTAIYNRRATMRAHWRSINRSINGL